MPGLHWVLRGTGQRLAPLELAVRAGSLERIIQVLTDVVFRVMFNSELTLMSYTSE